MLKSFYKYIIQNIIIGYFKSNPVKRGSRYFLVIEDKTHRDGLMEAIRDVSESITLSGIYSGNGTTVKEEPYDTLVLKASKDSIPLIIGYDGTSTEDYLTTIRNSVGLGGKYEDYGLLFVLSDSSSSILSSINTTVKDLQSTGGPLNATYIMNDIQSSARNKLTKDLEIVYLSKHLEKISEYVSDGTCTMFDFQYALNVLSEGTLKGHYNDLEFFNDKTVYDTAFSPTKTEMESRVSKNQEIFRKVSDVMNADDDSDRLKQLEKFLDERLSKQIVKSKDWKDIDFNEFLESIERKATTADLELCDVKVPAEGLLTRKIWLRTGNKKKSKNYIVVCDETNAEEIEVQTTFNKEIRKPSDKNECVVKGNVLRIFLKDKLIKQSVGLNDNHHDFWMMKLPCNLSFFQDIKECFSINKKGDIIVIVPDDVEKLTFGGGSKLLCIPIDGVVDWEDDARLEVPVIGDDDTETIDFTVDFKGQKAHFILKLNVAKPVPPAKPSEFPTDSPAHPEPNGIKTGDVTRPVPGYWRDFLDIEKAFVDNECTNIKYEYNALIDTYEPNYEDRDVPIAVKNYLIPVFRYFKEENTLPSLCPITDELRKLYSNYVHAVQNVILAIPSSHCMDREVYNLTKLGVVEKNGRVYLSPFHPLNVAYALEYDRQNDDKQGTAFARKLLSPFYLMPYIYYDSQEMRPYTDHRFDEIRNWLCYEPVSSVQQERTNDLTTRMVWTKMRSFIQHFQYLFQDKESPIIISVIGITNDTNVVKGIVEFIINQYKDGVQRIEIHEYVTNLMDETYFEKLNRLDSVDAIARELQSLNLKIESPGDYSAQDIIHQLFTRVAFYKHNIAEQQIGYSHIAFYQMETGFKFIRQMTSELRTELSLNGLISIPSTIHKNGYYIIGYGTKNQNINTGYIYPMAGAMNNLYANEENEGQSVYNPGICVAKLYKFNSDKLLNSIYDNANWVTFINPEVDINFFYKQKDLYVVHYTDQYTINAKYDSITVTKHVDQYDNMLRKSYEHYGLSEERFQHFNETMMRYFNCLNGSWMLDIVNKTEYQIREKMSIVAACIVMLKFMKRVANVIWIPLSLEEIFRVTGNIGLPRDYIFTKKALGAKGAMSDDLLMMGLDLSDPANIRLYFYPVEVKDSKNSSMSDKGVRQVCQTYEQFRKQLFGEPNFVKNIYRSFFATQFLTNAEKLNANSLLSDEKFAEIEKYRFDLLNLNYIIEDKLPIKEMGDAAVVSFYSQASHSMKTSIIDNIPVCEIHFAERECVQFVAEYETDNMDFLESDEISINEDTLDFISHPNKHDVGKGNESEIVVSSIDDEDDYNIDQESNKDAEEELNKSDQIYKREPTPPSIRIVVGYAQSGGREVVFEPNNTKVVSHPNMGIIGTMGTGKTQLARSVIAQFAKEGLHNLGGKQVGMLVFDYKGDYKDEEFLETVGGTCYKSKYPFNPLKLVINDEVDGMNLPAITADRISDSFAKAYGLGLKQQSNIKHIIIETYADAGITKDPSTWTNTVPTMEQVIEKYFDTYDTNDKAYALFDKLRDYTIFTTDNSNCVSLFEWLNSVRVIDLTLYPDDTKKVIVSLILDLFYAEMRQLGSSKQEKGVRELRAMIMVDEAHQFLKKDFNSFRSIISEGRMFGVGMILSTQNISDFKTSKEDYSQFILSWVIHHVNSISKSEIANIFGASDTNGERYMDFINKSKLFESICKIGSKVEGIRDLPFFELLKKDERFKKEDSLE